MEKLIKPQETDSLSNHFLTGAILFANLDYSGLSAYAIKAAIGGAIWMVFKLTGDFLSYKLINRDKSKGTKEENKQG
ncbi:MAG: hypothetical protein ABIP51_22375 [Bacteroidia bacterium]